MTKKMKLTLVFLVMTLTAIMGCLSAQAATPKIAAKKNLYITSSRDPEGTFYSGRGYIRVNGMKSGDKITSVKTNNSRAKAAVLKSKVTTKKNTYAKGRTVTIETSNLKPGKTVRVTIKIKRGKKTYTSYCNVKLQRNPQIFKSVKVGGKIAASGIREEYINEENGLFHIGSVMNISSGKKKVSISPASGVKIGSITVQKYDKYANETGNETKFKNNSYYAFSSGCYYIFNVFYTTNGEYGADWLNDAPVSLLFYVK